MSDICLASPRDGARYRELTERFGSPLSVLDAGRLREGYRAFRRALPRVGCYYAVKALPRPEVIEILAREGAGFDLASAGEVSLVQSLGVGARRTIHTHPIKSDAEIRAALRYGCTTFVVDNPFEIQKFVRYRHRVGLLVRIGLRGASARVDLSRKFGCAVTDVADLIDQARALGIHVKGLSFHVGSQVAGADDHRRAIETCRQLLGALDERGGAPLSVVDIGGGFPVSYRHHECVESIEDFCGPLRRALAGLPAHVEVIAEPGRCLSAPAVTAVCTVIGKARRGDQMWYYLDDGVYGSFSGQVFDGASYPITLFAGGVTHPRGVLAGPTCDSVDIIAEDVGLPDLGLGSIVIAAQMGAYTIASATRFNSLPLPRLVVVDGEQVRTPAAAG